MGPLAASLRSARGPAGILLAACVLALPGPAGAARPPGGAAGRARAAIAETKLEPKLETGLETELEAARSHRLYLVLDPSGPALDLKADGLVLRRFPVESALFGRSRLAAGELAWPALGFTLVSQLQETERPRIPIQAPEADPANAQAPVHATAKPAFSEAQDAAFGSTPTYYRLRFDPPLDVSILGEAGVANLPGKLWRARHRLIEGWEALLAACRSETVPPRVVLTMTPDEARRLFVTLLPRMRLVVAGPPAGPPSGRSRRGAAAPGAG